MNEFFRVQGSKFVAFHLLGYEKSRPHADFLSYKIPHACALLERDRASVRHIITHTLISQKDAGAYKETSLKQTIISIFYVFRIIDFNKSYSELRRFRGILGIFLLVFVGFLTVIL